MNIYTHYISHVSKAQEKERHPQPAVSKFDVIINRKDNQRCPRALTYTSHTLTVTAAARARRGDL